MKKLTIEEQRAKIKQLRLEAADPSLTAIRLAEEQAEAERKLAITRDKLEKWQVMKILKGEWVEQKGGIDLDKVAKRRSAPSVTQKGKGKSYGK